MRIKVFNPKPTYDLRKQLRKNQTDIEKLLWNKIRNKQINGYKFFRQYGVSNYILDFYCPFLRLAVEVDGEQHYSEEGMQYDLQRTNFLKGLDIKILRFTNLDVLKNVEGVIESIIHELPPTPSLKKREGKS